MSRRWLPVMAVVCGLVLIGCAQSSPEEKARDDARRRVEAAYGEIFGPPRIWPAEALGRRAIEVGLELLAIDGVESGGLGPGVTMIVRVYGVGFDQPLLQPEANRVELPFCFRLRFARLHVAHPPELVECPDTPPITYPPLAPAPPLPRPQAVREALEGVPVDAAKVRAALEALDLDERVVVDIEAGDGAVGVGLRSYGPFKQRDGCLLVRVGPDGVEAWHLSRAQDQPGELSCGGREAIVRAGQKPPH